MKYVYWLFVPAAICNLARVWNTVFLQIVEYVIPTCWTLFICYALVETFNVCKQAIKGNV